MFGTPATGCNKTKTPLSGGATGEDEVLQQKSVIDTIMECWRLSKTEIRRNINSKIKL